LVYIFVPNSGAREACFLQIGADGEESDIGYNRVGANRYEGFRFRSGVMPPGEHPFGRLLMRERRIAFALVLSIVFPLAARGADRQLDEAKRSHDTAVAKADAELQAVEKKCAAEKAAADARLIKAYEEAIKRATQHGDLTAANQLLAEKNAIQTGSGGLTSKWIDGENR
jgi:hypothetical protein